MSTDNAQISEAGQPIVRCGDVTPMMMTPMTPMTTPLLPPALPLSDRPPSYTLRMVCWLDPEGDNMNAKCFFAVLLSPLWIAAITAAEPAAEAKQRLAVLDFSTGEGLKPDDGQTLAMFVRSAVVQTGKFDVMDRQQIKQVLDEQKFQEVVCDDAKCMIKAGKILTVNRVMGGRIAKLGSVWTVVLNLVDVEAAKLINSQALPCDGPIESLLGHSSTAALMLLGLKPADSMSAAGAIQGRQLGEFYVNSVGALMLRVPPGEFMMGSTADERAWAVGQEGKLGGSVDLLKDEGDMPRRTRIPNAFWMGRTEVTVGQWRQFVSETGYQTEADKRGEAAGWIGDPRASSQRNTCGWLLGIVFVSLC